MRIRGIAVEPAVAVSQLHAEASATEGAVTQGRSRAQAGPGASQRIEANRIVWGGDVSQVSQLLPAIHQLIERAEGRQPQGAAHGNGSRVNSDEYEEEAAGRAGAVDLAPDGAVLRDYAPMHRARPIAPALKASGPMDSSYPIPTRPHVLFIAEITVFEDAVIAMRRLYEEVRRHGCSPLPKEPHLLLVLFTCPRRTPRQPVVVRRPPSA